MDFKRGSIYWVKLDPTIGSEIKKTRPALIVSNNAQNTVGKRFIVAPITSHVNKIYPFEVKISINGKVSKVMLDQLRTVDVQRLGSHIEDLSFNEMQEVEKALKIVLQIA